MLASRLRFPRRSRGVMRPAAIAVREWASALGCDQSLRDNPALAGIEPERVCGLSGGIV